MALRENTVALFPASEDVCHKAHDHHGQRLAVFFFGKEKSKDGPEGLCSMIYEPGLFCDLHQTAPDGHDAPAQG